MSDIRFNQWLHQSGTGGVSQVASGAVGVGTTNPLADFYVRGDAQITGILTAGHIAMGSSITFGDGDRAYFGDGTDMQLYHNGTNSYIENGTNALNIKSYQIFLQNANGSEDYLKATDGYGVELYHNNNKRIESTGYGATVFGELDTTNLSISGITTIGKVNQTLYSPHATNWATRSAITLFGNYGGGLAFNDNNNNGWVQHVSGSGVDFWLKNGAVGGALATSIKATKGGSVELYENNTKVFETASFGVNIVGGFVASGDCSIADKITHVGDLDTAIRFPAADTFSVDTGGSERLRIDSAGRVLIGTTTEGDASANNLTIASNTGYCGMTIRSGSSSEGNIFFSDATSGAGEYVGMLRYEHNNDAMVIKTANAERLRIDSSGRILIGTSTQNNNARLQVTTTNQVVATFEGTGVSDPQIYVGDNMASPTDNCIILGYDKADNRGYLTVGGDGDDTFTIANGGNIGIGIVNPGAALDVSGAVQATAGFKTAGHPIATYASFTDISGGSYATRLGSTGTSTLRSTQIYGGGSHIATFDGVNKRLGINLTVPTAKLHVSAAYNETGAIINGGALGYNDVLQCHTANGHRRFTVAGDGEIYGPSGGRKNWFDNGSFDCIGGRRNATSMDYGNHHAYGWVTDRFMSRNSVQWTRSTNVPTGKGFSYSTQTNGAGGQIMQAVELPDYGDMGVFTPGSYWCVSIWSTVGMNHSGSAFSYDLGSTRTDVTGVGSGSYATTGETAAGTSTGTFNRYYRVYGPMPSSIISGATGLYFQWGFTGAGYSTGWQLERVPTSTSKPTPYEHVHPAVTTARCRRYCWQNVNSRLMNGYKRHDSNIHWSEMCPVPPTHMPSGSNQSVSPYGVILHDGGLLSNFQSVLQNPGVNSLSISEFDYRSGRFILQGSTSYSSTHVTVPAWESQEYEIVHGFF